MRPGITNLRGTTMTAMMLKITPEASPKIVAALAAVNGKADRHTYTTTHMIRAVADEAERRLTVLEIPKAERTGAIYTAQSGEKLPSAYGKWAVIITVITLLRRTGGWYLTEIVAIDKFPTAAPVSKLTLTPAQDALAVAHLRQQYSVAIERPAKSVAA